MKLSRREHITLMLATGLSGCVSARSSLSTNESIKPDLDPLGGLGVVVVKDGQTILKYVTGFSSGLDNDENVETRPFTSLSPFRVASISKVATLLTARAMDDAGLLNLDEDVSAALGMRLRHPKYPNQPITLQNLLAHRSGISDPAVYWTEPSGDIRSLLSQEMFKNGRPGDWFEYANINYGIAATVMEARSNRRFDQLTRDHVFAPLGLDVGFNWAGVSRPKRRNGATLYRQVDGEMKMQTDGPKVLSDKGPVLYGDNPDFDLGAYKPGRNGTLLSPQGGLRASLDDLLVIAKSLAEHPELHNVDWRFDGQNGADGDGHFVSFGHGLYVYLPDLSPIPGQLMVGHHGEAYGMYGGLWHLPQLNVQIVHAVTATPQPPKPYHPRPPAIAAESRVLLDAAMSALGL